MSDLTTKEKKFFMEHLDEVVELLSFLRKKGHSPDKAGALLLSGAAMLVYNDADRKEAVQLFDEICRLNLGLREDYEVPPNFEELH
jgi:hypothetical protein|tara:strand:+ start:2132 stop:2389 length:258 start_codon:yes stop_codon:yes gene_type:complete